MSFQTKRRSVVVSSGEVVRVKSKDQLLAGYLTFAPIALAIFRRAELGPLARVELQRPVLEIGCGAGLFARCALCDSLDVGLDISPRQIRRARATKCYTKLDVADARRMPYGDSSFRTVVAISVLEHIEAPEHAVQEAYRVLQPGGTLIATIVLRDLDRSLAVPQFLARMGLSSTGGTYTRAFNAVFRHVSMRSEGDWDEILRGAGFQVTRKRTVVSQRTMRWFEAFLLTAWPYRLRSRWNGRMLRPIWGSRMLARWLADVVRDAGSGCCLFVFSRKPEAALGGVPNPSAVVAGTTSP
jgi:SAM-dependent methyltransferase